MMLDLPLEVLFIITSFLSIQELFVVRCVCKLLRRVAEQQCRRRVKYIKLTRDTAVEIVPSISSFLPNVKKIRICNGTKSPSCALSFTRIIRIASFWRNVNAIELIDCTDCNSRNITFISATFTNLTSILLHNISITDQALSSLLRKLPLLKQVQAIKCDLLTSRWFASIPERVTSVSWFDTKHNYMIIPPLSVIACRLLQELDLGIINLNYAHLATFISNLPYLVSLRLYVRKLYNIRHLKLHEKPLKKLVLHVSTGLNGCFLDLLPCLTVSTLVFRFNFHPSPEDMNQFIQSFPNLNNAMFYINNRFNNHGCFLSLVNQTKVMNITVHMETTGNRLHASLTPGTREVILRGPKECIERISQLHQAQNHSL